MGTPISELVFRRPLDWSEISNRKIGIDTHNTLYQFLSNIRSVDGSPLMNSKGRVTSHLTGLLYRTAGLVEHGVKPVFVFDGKPLALKSRVLDARREVRTNAKEKFERAKAIGDLAEARKFASQSSSVTPEIVESAKELLQLLGFPVVQAPSDGEAQIAFMVANGDVFAGVSQDYDALLFGCERVIRNLAFAGKRKVPGRNVFVDVEPELVELDVVLRRLEIDRPKLVWLGILVGTDFNEKFPKIGPKTALKIVQANNSFEEIVKYTGFKPEFDPEEIAKIFLEPAHTDKYHIEFSLPNKEKVKKFLVDEHDFSEERVNNVLNKLEQKLGERGEQSRLFDWNAKPSANKTNSKKTKK